jgi:hypothetical protein
MQLDGDYRLEVRSYRGRPAAGVVAVREGVDVVDASGETIEDGELFALAHDLCDYDGECVEGALDALLGYADELAEAERHVAEADAADAGVELWETAFAADPEAPDAGQLSEYDVDAFARSEAVRLSTLTGRMIEAFEYAAGGSR